VNERTSKTIAVCGCLGLLIALIATPIAWMVVGPFALIIPLAVSVLMVFATRNAAPTGKKSISNKEAIEQSARALSDPSSSSYSYRGPQRGGPSRPGSSILSGTGAAYTVAIEDRYEDYRDDKIRLGRKLASGTSLLMFEYSDVNGVVTDRSVTDWTEFRHHIRGYCLTACGDRTFRKDRVVDWVAGRENLKSP